MSGWSYTSKLLMWAYIQLHIVVLSVTENPVACMSVVFHFTYNKDRNILKNSFIWNLKKSITILKYSSALLIGMIQNEHHPLVQNNSDKFKFVVRLHTCLCIWFRWQILHCARHSCCSIFST